MTSDPAPAPTPDAAPTPEQIVAAISASWAGTLDDRMGVELVEASLERVVLRMPVAGNTQPYGLLHGGANAVLAESAGSIASALWAAPDRIAVGVDLNVTHHRSVRAGTVTAVATPLSRGRSVATHEIVVSDEEGRRLATARLTCLLRESAP